MAFEIPETSACLNCRYILRGLENPVCPECGQKFDPHDPRTYFDPLRRGVFYRWADPPRNYLRYILIIWALSTLIFANELDSVQFASRTFRDRFQHAAFIAMVVLCLPIALQHIAMSGLARRCREAGAPAPSSRLMRWWWAPLCISLVLIATSLPWPLWIRFHLSQPWLESAAKKQLAIGSGEIGIRICGGYLLESVRVYSAGSHDVVFLRFAGTDGAGFIYSPDPTWARYFASPMGEHWYYTKNWR